MRLLHVQLFAMICRPSPASVNHFTCFNKCRQDEHLEAPYFSGYGSLRCSKAILEKAFPSALF